MNLLKTVKCILCLIKCSKYLYYIKKGICALSILLIAVVLLSAATDKKSLLKSLKVK